MNFNTLEILVITFFSCFTLLSLLSQFSKLSISKYDFFGILPNYHFFAPRPVTRDIRIYVQASFENNKSNWKELFFAEKKWFCFIWNPHHKLRKAVIDLYSQLDDFREADDIWHLTYPYLTILNCANSIFKDVSDYENIQFMITCFAGYEEDVHDIIFISNQHNIDRTI